MKHTSKTNQTHTYYLNRCRDLKRYRVFSKLLSLICFKKVGYQCWSGKVHWIKMR